MTVKPLGNKLHVFQQPARVPANGIIIPPAFAGSLMQGDTKVFRVLAVGSKVMDVNPGDVVICYSHTSGPLPVGDDEHIITDDQIIAVVPKQ